MKLKRVYLAMGKVFQLKKFNSFKTFLFINENLIQAHKKLIKTVKEQIGFSDYGMYWLAFLEGGLTIWLLDRVFFHWLNFNFYQSQKIIKILN